MAANELAGRNLINELTVDEQDIERRKKYVDLTADDQRRIASLKDIVAGRVDQIVEHFFEYLSAFDEAKGLFRSSTLDEAKRLKKDHLLAMVNGKYDEHYVDQRLKLGRLYSKAGLESKVFLGAFRHLIQMISETVLSELSGSPQEALQNILSLEKVAFVDLGLIVDVLVFDREQTIRQQQEAIKELSTPVLQMRDRLLILPIVGMIDTYRAKLLTENLLRAIRAKRAKVVVIDITGVAAVDSKVANHLVQTVAASRLMGAQVIVTGLSAEVAQTLVTLGVELSKLDTVGDLQGGIEEAERILGTPVNSVPSTVPYDLKAPYASSNT